jgi:23S rRNA (adenine2503-C2)-methyltransferase
MPGQQTSPLKKLIEAVREHPASTGRLPTFEYVLLHGFNLGQANAKTLLKLLNGLDCRINLIPFNEAPDCKFRCPPVEEQERFRSLLEEGGLKVTLRRSSGKDIAAGCGQLATEILLPKKGRTN